MRILCISLFVLGFLKAGPCLAQDVATQYLKLQETYSLRTQDIEDRYRKRQRELLNKFILALVRVEQSYRDNGELDGVVYCRELRETLLTSQGVPEIDEEAPQAVRVMLSTLQRKRDGVYKEHQKELTQFNKLLLAALEAYVREFTRQGMIEKALEVQRLQTKLTESLALEIAETSDLVTISSVLSSDPNVYPLAIEAPGYSKISGVTPRKSMWTIPLNERGVLRKTEKGIVFVNGSITIPANQSGPLIEDMKRNRMFTAEIAFQPSFDFQGDPESPVVVMQFGETLETSNMAVSLEGHDIIVYLKTITLPEKAQNYRLEIGKLKNVNHVHIQVTYRADQLSIYLNGSIIRNLRNQIDGSISGWELAPILLGKALESEQGRNILPFRGTLNHLYFKAGVQTSRQAASNYERYISTL